MPCGVFLRWNIHVLASGFSQLSARHGAKLPSGFWMISPSHTVLALNLLNESSTMLMSFTAFVVPMVSFIAFSVCVVTCDPVDHPAIATLINKITNSIVDIALFIQITIVVAS